MHGTVRRSPATHANGKSGSYYFRLVEPRREENRLVVARRHHQIPAHKRERSGVAELHRLTIAHRAAIDQTLGVLAQLLEQAREERRAEVESP